MSLHELGDVRVAALGAELLTLLLELVVEHAHEELGELLCILLLGRVELERVDERLGVVDGLLRALEESEEDLNLEERGCLQVFCVS